MVENQFGEIVPVIDKSLCVNCNLCVKICPQNDKPDFVYPQKCFVAWSKKESDLLYSASGGVSPTFLRHVTAKDGIAYGCDYNDNADLIHFAIKDGKDLFRSQSSKYSQSSAFCVFEEIKGYLSAGRKVMFIGTPCQVAGLHRYLKIDYEYLITVDLICHGTPPNTYLKEHLNKIVGGRRFSKVRFRGEFDRMLSVWDNDEIIYQKEYFDDIYFNMFYRNIISRDSCYTCQYAQAKRVSDITIGDFWGLKGLSEIEKKSNRPSIVLVNTDKGRIFFEEVKDNLYCEERPIEEGVSGNGRLIMPPGKDLRAYIFRFLYVFFRFEKSVKILTALESGLAKFIKKLRGGL